MARKIFESNLEELHNDLLKMGDIVEKQIYQSIEALVNKDISLAEKTIKDDDIVDNMQYEIEDKCIKLIATQQPLAGDLRKIFSTIKIVTDLERMADHAVDISKTAKILANEEYMKELVDIPKISKLVKKMIEQSLDSYVNADVEKAYEVCKMDDEVDEIYEQVFKELLVFMSSDPRLINQAAQFLFICKFLERIADHTTNICESTIYLVTGVQVDLNE